jgi:hypothetical protein
MHLTALFFTEMVRNTPFLTCEQGYSLPKFTVMSSEYRVVSWHWIRLGPIFLAISQPSQVGPRASLPSIYFPITWRWHFGPGYSWPLPLPLRVISSDFFFINKKKEVKIRKWFDCISFFHLWSYLSLKFDLSSPDRVLNTVSVSVFFPI